MFDNVLVVDDDPIFCELLRVYLKQAGAGSIFVAHDGNSALDTLTQEHRIDFIVLDLNMPEFDGIEFLGKIKDIPFSGAIAIVSAETPVVISMAEYLGTLYGLNIVDTVKKPLIRQDVDRWCRIETAAKPSRSHHLDAASQGYFGSVAGFEGGW